ncbi:AAA family ATPase [Hymenobacter caeli]|uniref:NadR type nicotinamide-nucleotide adenylyltransferase n=1 Tax=Hymenobacter caeli TaxID=2735894 RepID=A0ABX2FVI9_9BACT|nr:ATP-binding protein [Hymenobacter caeli]NRT20808.1 NadR type nicotinamide-nucleotide adenylyltransferase [Hymenobacter caeli]
MLRIALTGPESTGKSTLCQQLAAHYHAPCAPEYARAYLAGRRPPYALADLEAIARGQLAAEAQAAAATGRVVFCDTDLLVIKIWAEHAFGRCPDWIARRVAQQRYDLVLLMGVDMPWEPDPLREHPEPHLRQHFYRLYQRELAGGAANFAEIWGAPAQRFATARRLVDALLRAGPRP